MVSTSRVSQDIILQLFTFSSAPFISPNSSTSIPSSSKCSSSPKKHTFHFSRFSCCFCIRLFTNSIGSHVESPYRATAPILCCQCGILKHSSHPCHASQTICSVLVILSVSSLTSTDPQSMMTSVGCLGTRNV